MTPNNFQQINIKVFIKKLFRRFLTQKVKAPPVCGGVFVFSGRLGVNVCWAVG
jgi:hypothetical protein